MPPTPRIPLNALASSPPARQYLQANPPDPLPLLLPLTHLPFSVPPLHWLAPGHIPCGRITLLLGPHDSGKTALALDLAACLSTHRPWPVPSPDAPEAPAVPPCSTLFVTPYHDPSHSIISRILALHPDPQRIYCLPLPWPATSPLAVLLPQLRAAIKHDPSLRLIVIDPITPLLSPALTPARSLLPLLADLAAWAADCAIAILATRCLDHAASRRCFVDPPLHLVCHHAYHLSFAPDDPHRRLIRAFKFAAPQPPPPLALHLAGPSVSCRIDPSIPALHPAAHAPPADDNSPALRQLDHAIAWLRAAIQTGPLHAATVPQLAQDVGISPRTLRRAKSALRIPSRRVLQSAGPAWLWSLPAPVAVVRTSRSAGQPPIGLARRPVRRMVSPAARTPGG